MLQMFLTHNKKKYFTSMDVSFQESVPYYPNSDIQEEQLQESQSWIFMPSDPEPSQQPMNTDVTSPSPPETPPRIRQHSTQARIHDSPPTSDPSIAEQGIISSLSTDVPDQSDLSLPIAWRKPSRSCGPYQIEDYVYHGNLSNSYQAFVSKLDQIQIPNSVEEALKVPEWRATTYEEIRALEKNETWDITELPPEKKKAVGVQMAIHCKEQTIWVRGETQSQARS